MSRTCIVCPRGCRLRIRRREGQVEVAGNECPKGVEHGIQEATAPMRVLTTTVRTMFPALPRLAVKSSAEVLLSDIPRFMRLIDAVSVDREVGCGEVICADLLGDGVHLLATDELTGV